jgi:hypothetical protein
MVLFYPKNIVPTMFRANNAGHCFSHTKQKSTLRVLLSLCPHLSITVGYECA